MPTVSIIATQRAPSSFPQAIPPTFIAYDSDPRVYAHPNTGPNLVLLLQAGIERVHGLEHPQSCQDGALRVILVRGRKAEIRQ
jgi:hypothetical protein